MKPELSGSTVVVGRILSIRGMKRTKFVDVYTADTARTQLLLEESVVAGKTLAKGDCLVVEGNWGTSKTGEPSLIVTRIHSVVPFTSSNPFNTSVLEARNARELQRDLLSKVRNFFTERSYVEVVTPFVVPRFNGGNSTPTRVKWTGGEGVLRATYEDRLLAILAESLRPVFQVGPIFKGGAEIAFLEAYCVGDTIQAAESLAGDFLFRVRDGVQIKFTDFWDLAESMLSDDEATKVGECLIGSVSARKWADQHLDIPVDASDVGMCDRLGSTLSKRAGGWVGISRFPAIHSPLYRLDGSATKPFQRIDRSRVYKDGSLVMDLGVNDLDAESVALRMGPASAGSDYLDSLSMAPPPTIGLSVRLDLLRNGE